MKSIQAAIWFVFSITCYVPFLFVGKAAAQILQVTSVTVDTVWNSDSSWYDFNGIPQQRTSRDCRVSFIPQGEGMVRMMIAMSVDSGKTWSTNLLNAPDNTLSPAFMTGQKATITVRVLGGDRPGTVFKMTARQVAPAIAASPKILLLGLTEVLTPGQNVGATLGLRFARDTSVNGDGFCPISKVYWDALADGTINDSTTGAHALVWTWPAQVPAGPIGQLCGVIARAVDKNGLWSAPETCMVKFGIMVDSVTDIDGNVYHIVRIGTQEWTMENLRVARYNDGTAIPMDTSAVTWADTAAPKFCYYGNTTNTDSIRKFGALYNWYVLSRRNPHKIAPAGWHVPSDSEWTILENYLIANGYNWDGSTSGNKMAKSLAAQTDWQASSFDGAIGKDLTGNNASGFSALPGGYRILTGNFINFGLYTIWWSATEFDASYAWFRCLSNDFASTYKINSFNKKFGFSVRLVRD
jgi:uncharacterized protein (TIGR02145 family)